MSYYITESISEEPCYFDTLSTCGLTFDCDNCGRGDGYRWVWSNEATPTDNTGPEYDHTTGSGRKLKSVDSLAINQVDNNS